MNQVYYGTYCVHKKYFHIIIEPAPNLNKTKIYFSAFLLNSRHFEFQISSTQGKFLDFLQKRFFIDNRFITNFFQRMGGKRVRACAGPAAPAPALTEKIRYATIFNEEKNVFVKRQGIYLESS